MAWVSTWTRFPASTKASTAPNWPSPKPGAHGRGGGPGRRRPVLALGPGENLEATLVAEVTAEPRLRMTWRGRTIADLGRDFLDTNGARPVHPGADPAPAAAAPSTRPRCRRASWKTVAGVPGGPRQLQPAGPDREIRLHHRRRHRAGPVRRPPAPDPGRGHGSGRGRSRFAASL